MFDIGSECMDVVPIWVRLPCLPLEFWTKDIFKLIGNTLGSFIDAYMSFLESDEYVVAQILIQINLWEGLVEDLELGVWREDLQTEARL
jgi:hypothetical protein